MKLTSFYKKLHLLDYLIILAVILSGIILFKFFNPQEKWISIEVINANIPTYQAYSIKKGDTEKDPTGKTSAEIENITLYDNLLQPANPSSLFVNSANKDLRINVKILAKVNSRSGEYEYKNKILKVGSPIELRFTTGIVNGVISSLATETQPQKMQPIIVTLKIYEVWPWLADSIKIGDTSIGENEQKLVEILDKEVNQSEVTIDTVSGTRILGSNPQKVDLTLKVRILTQKFGDEYIFEKDRRILIGETLSFNVSKTRILDANIIDIE